MKISRSPVSPPKPSPAHVTAPRKPAAPVAGRAGDGFEAPRVNDGVSGGNVKLRDFDSFGAHTQPSRTVTTELPTGSTPGQTAGQNARLGSTLGAEVTPDGFSREARLRDLLKFDRTPVTHDPGMQKQTDLLTDTSAPQESDGKNSTTSRGNASEGFPDLNALVAIAKGESATNPPIKEPAQPESRPWTISRAWAEFSRLIKPSEPEKKEHAVANGTRATPNPENDVGDVRPGGPDFLSGAFKRASIAELIDHRARQVSQPGEGQGRPARVHASHDVAVKEGLRQRTDGRIDPGEQAGAAPTSGTGPITPGAGGGIEQVDGSHPGDPRKPGEE